MGKVRDVRFDTLKGLLILCVLYRHFIIHDTSLDIASVSSANFVHLFTMPLFVFISGYFTRHVEDKKQYWKGILRIFETYVIFQLIKGIAYHYPIWWLISVPAPMMWYMLALIYWKALYYALYLLKVKINKQFLLAFVVLSLVAGFVSSIGRGFALGKFFYFGPWFFLGIICQKINIIEEVNNRTKSIVAWIVLSLALIGTIVAAVLHFDNLAGIFGGGDPYPSNNQWLYLFYRFLSYGVSMAVSIAVIKLFAKTNKILEIVGIDSLKFYMFHGLGLMVVNASPIPKGFILALVYATVVAVVIFFFNKTKLSDFTIAPISYVMNYKKTASARRKKS